MLDGSRRPEGALSQRSVHLVIGQLITDGAFRRRVERSGSAYLGGLRTQGIDLSRLEIAALIEVDPSVWASVAKQIHLTSKADRDARDDEGPRAHDTLTLQQQRVLTGVCDGLRNQDIATQLRISEGAVKATLQQLFHKFSVRRRVQLVRVALDEPLHTTDRSRAVRHTPSSFLAHRGGAGVPRAS